MDAAFKALQNIGVTNVDENLRDVQLGSIATMEMFGKTFSGILIAFQRQLNSQSEIESKLQDIDSKIKGLDSKLTETQQSIENAVDSMDYKLQQQSNATNNALQSITDSVDTAKSETNQALESMMEMVTKRLSASSRTVENVESELNRFAVSLQSVSGKVDNALHSITEKQQNIESQLQKTQQNLNDDLSAIQRTIEDDKAILNKAISSVSDQFQSLRFEVDRIASSKADIADLKRKANATEFKTLQKSVSKMEETVNSEIDTINTTMNADRSKFEGEIAGNKQSADCRLSECDQEIERINQTVGSLEYKFREKQSADREQQNLLPIIKAMQKDIGRLLKANDEKPNAAGSTGSGSCFSCGQRVNSFPALPPRLRSPDKKNIGGGFTLDTEPKSNLTFSEKMRNDLAQIASDIAPPTQHHKFPVDRKPHKLPSLTKSGTTPQL